MSLTWYPRGRWPSPCAGCGKKIPAASRRAHDPATNKFYHPACAPSPDHDNGGAKPPRSGQRSLEAQSKAGDLPGFVTGDKLKPGPPRVAIYARVSTTKQETENQVVQLREYAARMGWSVAEVLKETEHGWEPEREKLQELLDLARFREIDIALVWALDRFSRQGVAATLKLVEDLHRSGVKLWSYQEPFLRESDPAMAELVLSFLAWAAKQEHMRISERTKAGLERVRANGTKLGRPKLHSFDPEEAKRLRGEGKSWNETIKELGLPAEARGSVVRAVATLRAQ